MRVTARLTVVPSAPKTSTGNSIRPEVASADPMGIVRTARKRRTSSSSHMVSFHYCNSERPKMNHDRSFAIDIRADSKARYHEIERGIRIRKRRRILFEAYNNLCSGMPLFDISDGVSGVIQLITRIDYRGYFSGFHEFAQCCQVIFFRLRNKERELLA